MRADLELLLDDITLVTLSLAIAVGWSLYNLLHGIATLIDGLLTHVGQGEIGYGGLTWTVRDHLIELDGILYGAIELTLALAVAVWVARRSRT